MLDRVAQRVRRAVMFRLVTSKKWQEGREGGREGDKVVTYCNDPQIRPFSNIMQELTFGGLQPV